MALARGDSGNVLRSDPTALAPEALLVFELRAQLLTFAIALSEVPGLELIGEDIAELADDDGVDFEGFYYLVMPDAAAIDQLLALWQLWEKDKALGQAHRHWAKVFDCLHDLRRWGPADRMRPRDAEYIRDLAKHAPNENIVLEIELIFRAGAVANTVRTAAIADIAAVGGKLLHQARHDAFAFDALLVSLPAKAALAAANHDAGSLASLDAAFSIHVQSVLDAAPVEGDEEESVATEHEAPDGEPIVAIIDATPLQNHLRLGPRLILADPLQLEPLNIGKRRHGTAMASLIIHGDLGAGGAALPRPVLHVPLMYAQDPVLLNREHECARPDRILVDDFVTAVLAIKRGSETEAPLGPNVLVINVSLGDLRRPFHGRISPWARAMDWLAAELGVLFVVSAGNALHDFTIGDLVDAEAFAASQGVDRSRAVLAGMRDDMRNRTLLSPAESINALTVGALHDDIRAGAANIGSVYDPIPDGRFPTVVSRMGPGFARAVKPDILMSGGRLRVSAADGGGSAVISPRSASQFGGLSVCAPGVSNAAIADQQGWSGASSGAAALATRGAHRIHDALEAAYGPAFMDLSDARKAMVLKALLTHRARWPLPELNHVMEIFGPAEKSKHMTRKMNAMRLFGFGVAHIDEAIGCIESRATLWGEGEVEENGAARFSCPLPVSLSGQKIPHAVTATVAWFSPPLPGRRAYKSVRLTVEEPVKGVLKLLGVKPARDMGDRMQTERGTVFHRRWEGKSAAALVTGDRVEFHVARKPDREDVEDTAPIAFAVAVSIEADADLPIYSEVGVEVEVKPQVGVWVQT